MVSESSAGGNDPTEGAADLRAPSSENQPECVSRRVRDADGSDDLALAAQALFALGRAFGRQSVRDLVGERSGRAIDLSRVLVAQALYDEAGHERGAERARAGEQEVAEVTVGAVAERLGIDPSTASRLVADAVRDGYLVRSASAHDARRVRLGLTEAGRVLVDASRRFQRQVFLDATATWSEAERVEFARSFVRFAEAVTGRYAEVVERPSMTAPVSGELGAG